ncbi:MAG: FKBP-type peptidyl-prolyl cis-trans isomerase [Leptolyngbya sp.]|nr:FKBP-type peptidyl-prolyl cis-trans isomerase [Candidatus Melainabacteria bacterium]
MTESSIKSKKTAALAALLTLLFFPVESTAGEKRFTTGDGTKLAQANDVTSPSGLKYHDEVVGQGPSPRQGQKVSVHYTGWLTDGKQFDSSRNRGPFQFTIGKGEVIKGWDEGVASMKVGGKRKLTVPSHLGYGDRGFPPVIPPGSTLIFDVELLGVQ